MRGFLHKISIPFSRLALFTVYFWFGLLKAVGESPASLMVKKVFDETIALKIASLEFSHFLIAFGLFEMVIGLIFLSGKFDRLGLVLVVIHLALTALPLFIPTGVVWSKPWVPTIEGQYILKNLVILALAVNLASRRQ